MCTREADRHDLSGVSASVDIVRFTTESYKVYPVDKSLSPETFIGEYIAKVKANLAKMSDTEIQEAVRRFVPRSYDMRAEKGLINAHHHDVPVEMFRYDEFNKYVKSCGEDEFYLLSRSCIVTGVDVTTCPPSAVLPLDCIDQMQAYQQGRDVTEIACIG